MIELNELWLIHGLAGVDRDGDGIPDSLQSRGAVRSSTLDLSDHDQLLREASAFQSQVGSHTQDAKGAYASQQRSF